MLKNLIFLVLFVNLVKGKGEVTILNSPPGAYFKGNEPLTDSDLLEIYSAALGFSVKHNSSFSGFYITNPFELAHCVVVVNVDGITSLGDSAGQTFPLKTNSDINDISALSYRIQERFPNKQNIIDNINLIEGLNGLKDIGFLEETNEIEPPKRSYKFLKPTDNEDQEFIEEIKALDAITQQIADGVISDDSQPDYFNIKCSALHAVSDSHGEKSPATVEAKQVLLDAVHRLNSAFKETYSNKVLFALITNDASHTRRTRQAAQPEATDNVINRAKTYNSNYPVIFNIILWFGVIMVFTLLAISLAIGNMDPGRDSIIYRMTSTRMKKDN